MFSKNLLWLGGFGQKTRTEGGVLECRCKGTTGYKRGQVNTFCKVSQSNRRMFEESGLNQPQKNVAIATYEHTFKYFHSLITNMNMVRSGVVLIALLALLAITALTLLMALKTDRPNISYLYPDFFRGRFSVEGEPILNYPVNVTFSIQPIKDMPNTKVRLLLPEGIEAEGPLEWTDLDVNRDQKVELKTILKAIKKGEWEIRAYVVSILPDHKEHMTYSIYFLSSGDQGEVTETPTKQPSLGQPSKVL